MRQIQLDKGVWRFDESSKLGEGGLGEVFRGLAKTAKTLRPISTVE